MRRFAPAMVNSGRKFATTTPLREAAKEEAAKTTERAHNYINPAQIAGLVVFYAVTITGIKASGVMESSH